MQTPIITKKQAQKTLAAKKKKPEVIKNVLAKPYESYWPLLLPEDNTQLTETLERLLPRLKPPKINIPYKEISAIPKHERKKFRASHTHSDFVPAKDCDRHGIVFGVNDASNLLDNREAASVLIASDVQPRLLVQHILDQAVLHHVPVLAVRDLRDILKSRCGLKGAVIALKNTIQTGSSLELIQACITNISENYPPPSDHINSHRAASVVTISDSDLDVTGVSEKTVECKNYHLKRQGDKRAFVPGKSQQNSGYINFDASDVLPAKTPTINYKSLKVKRVKGDKNRNKRKMKTFKPNVKNS